MVGPPDLYLCELESTKACFLRMSRETYLASVFTDPSRIVAINEERLCVDLNTAMTLAPAADTPSPHAYIFHMAHCGSTLLSRALDLPGKTLGIREPFALRQLALGQDGARAGAQSLDGCTQVLTFVVRLLGRTYHQSEKVVVKTNVPVNFMLEPLLKVSLGSLGVFLYPDLKFFLLMALKNPQRRQWVENLFAALRQPLRAHDPNSRIDWGSMTIARAAGFLWFAQLSCMAKALHAHDGFVSLRADTLFNTPSVALKVVSKALNLGFDNTEIEASVAGDLFRRHAKALDQPYDNTNRLTQTRNIYAHIRTDVDDAITWVERLSEHYELPMTLPNECTAE